MVKSSFIEKTYVHMLYEHIGIASLRQFQCIPTTYVTENKEEKYLEIYIFQLSCPIVFTSFKHLKLPISIKIPVIVYICMAAISPNSSS